MNLRKLRNPFLIIWIVLFLFILIPGHITIKSFYDNPFPGIENYNFPIILKEKGDINTLKPAVSLVCDSFFGYDVPIVGDEFECSLSYTDYSGFGKFGEVHLNGTAFIINYNPATNEAIRINVSRGYIPIGTLEGLEEYENISAFSFPILTFPIPREGINRFALNIPLIDKENSTFVLKTDYIPYIAVLPDDYRKAKTEKMGLYISLFTLSAFISLSGVKNLMDIWYKNKKYNIYEKSKKKSR